MGKVLCLLYHRVNRIEDPFYNLVVTPEHFEEQMEYLKEHYNIFRFEEDWTRGSDNSVVVTFDDGYADNCIYALPILEKKQIPATIFVSSGYVNANREYWWDELVRLLTRNIDYPEHFALSDNTYSYTWETDTYQKRVDLIKSLHWLLKMEPDYTLAFKWFESLRNWAGIENNPRIENLPINKQQLKKLDESEYITLGGHTVNHISLGAIQKELQEYEISTSVNDLRKQIKGKINVFSFPFGSKVHYNEDTLNICKRNGIIKSATTVKGVWNVGDDQFQIPRVAIEDCEIEEFKQIIHKYMED